MKFEFDSNLPLYIQLIDRIKGMLISDEISPGSQLPSVRKLAQIWDVSPNTIQRALATLEEEGLIETRRTTRKFVTNDKEKLLLLRKKVLEKTIQKTISTLRQQDFSEDIFECVRRELKPFQEKGD